MEIPTINIPPRLRFALYLLASLAVLASSYFIDRGFTWWGDAEVKLVNGAIALVGILAASNTTTRRQALPASSVEGEVLDRVDDTTDLADSAGVLTSY